MKNLSLILKAKKKIFMEYLEITRVMFVTGLIRMKNTPNNKILLKKKLHNKLKRTRKMRRKQKYVRS
jgi:hypothetical protein